MHNCPILNEASRKKGSFLKGGSTMYSLKVYHIIRPKGRNQ
nr:MAG TPA: hypothetical protein [Caudoviricetes sp.]